MIKCLEICENYCGKLCVLFPSFDPSLQYMYQRGKHTMRPRENKNTSRWWWIEWDKSKYSAVTCCLRSLQLVNFLGLTFFSRTCKTLPQEVTVCPFHFHLPHSLPKLSSAEPDKIFPLSSLTTHNDLGQIQVLTVYTITGAEEILRNEEMFKLRMKGIMCRSVLTPQLQDMDAHCLC